MTQNTPTTCQEISARFLTLTTLGKKKILIGYRRRGLSQISSKVNAINSRYGFSAFSERTNENTTNCTFGVLKHTIRVLLGLAAKRAKNSAVGRKQWKILNVSRRIC